METTMSLLDKALEYETLPFWHRELKLHRATLSAARKAKRLSPVLAGAMAAKLGEDPFYWTAIAVAEGERESGAKDVYMKWLAKNTGKTRAMS